MSGKRYLIGWLMVFSLMTFDLAGAAATGPSAVTVHPGEVLRGQFVQVRTMKGFSKPLTSEGTFTIAPQYGLIWNGTKPFHTATVITAGGLVQSNNGVETLNLSARKLPFVSQLYGMIGGMLTGDMTQLQKSFTLEQSGTAEHWRIRMLPRQANDAHMPFTEIMAYGGRFVEGVKMVRTGGDADVLTFHNVTLSSSPLSAEERTRLGVK